MFFQYSIHVTPKPRKKTPDEGRPRLTPRPRESPQKRDPTPAERNKPTMLTTSASSMHSRGREVIERGAGSGALACRSQKNKTKKNKNKKKTPPRNHHRNNNNPPPPQQTNKNNKQQTNKLVDEVVSPKRIHQKANLTAGVPSPSGMNGIVQASQVKGWTRASSSWLVRFS